LPVGTSQLQKALLRHEETDPSWQVKVEKVPTMASMLNSGNEHTVKKPSELRKKVKIKSE
jgi:hypothetical protein